MADEIDKKGKEILARIKNENEFFKSYYPDLWQKGIESAVETEDCVPGSLYAAAFSKGFCRGYLSSTGELYTDEFSQKIEKYSGLSKRK